MHSETPLISIDAIKLLLLESNSPYLQETTTSTLDPLCRVTGLDETPGEHPGCSRPVVAHSEGPRTRWLSLRCAHGRKSPLGREGAELRTYSATAPVGLRRME